MNTTYMADLAVINADILTMSAKQPDLTKATMLVKDGQILALGHNLNYQAKQTIDATNMIALPGLINGHTHVPMAAFKGLADDLPLQTWLRKHIWPAEAKHLSSDFVYKSARLAMAELITEGITCFADGYFWGLSTAKAAQEAGLRAIIGEAVMDFPFGPHKNVTQMLDYTIKAADQYKDNPLIDFCIAPHSVYTCTPSTLKRVADVATQHKLRVHIHAAETKTEVEDCKRDYNYKPIELIDHCGLLSHNTILAHGVWVNQAEAKLIAAASSSVVVNTKSNLKLASGFAPLKIYKQNKVNWCYGTDGSASNNRLSLLSEINHTCLLHKTLNCDPTFLPAPQALQAATVNAAKALSLPNIGQLSPGMDADFILMHKNQVQAHPYYDLYSHIVYASSSKQIGWVFVNGRALLANGKLTTLDETELMHDAQTLRQQVMPEMS